ncbi:hypothetical protein I4513_02565 [Klebsiella oxytoca]|uniref:hypothetical protein n=1 Tax=Klebsiella TaxID=570 RepID=UPI0013D673B6|nr:MULTISPECIES: hypothetical protein [Klebsiella]EKU6743074.1 hypothetical protein [Klebsiella oxytoca]EKU7135143.1 hypothetical protein [Klebsiella oxytoca]EKV0268112.1 hypothetical protein [Klebsiella oxytoca]EKV1581667.1 hypothetical protein [Klebsiella oxytoca]EKV9015399.1 hypothetical protein [Klebsiella oxytoca]
MAIRRIAYAYYDPEWMKLSHSLAALKRNTVEPLAYLSHMKGFLFCPSCYEHLTRVPADPEKEMTSNEVPAYYKHLKDDDAPPCSLRCGPIQYKKYATQEDAKKAVEDEELIVISGFLQTRPENNPRVDFGGDEVPIDSHFEREDGKEVSLPIARHNGESFRVPSQITSIQSLCANFIHNYYREIYLLDEDGRAKRYRFCDSLKNINELREECDEPRFLFGAVFRVEKFKGHSNIWLRIDNSTPYRDFRIRITNDTAEGRGFLNDRNLGRIAMFYSKVNGAGLGFITPELGWGEVALLPDKYDDFLNRVYHEDDTDN